LLERLGYNVLGACGGEEAVAIVRSNPDRIALVILDMVMPGMDGVETFRRIREIHPEARILLSSGYSTEFGGDEIPLDERVGFLQKPYGIRDLAVKLREVLE
jgi:CheY-like chemotaxis protein